MSLGSVLEMEVRAGKEGDRKLGSGGLEGPGQEAKPGEMTKHGRLLDESDGAAEPKVRRV